MCISVQPKYAISSMLLLDYALLPSTKATSMSKERPNPLLLLGQRSEPTLEYPNENRFHRSGTRRLASVGSRWDEQGSPFLASAPLSALESPLSEQPEEESAPREQELIQVNATPPSVSPALLSFFVLRSHDTAFESPRTPYSRSASDDPLQTKLFSGASESISVRGCVLGRDCVLKSCHSLTYLRRTMPAIAFQSLPYRLSPSRNSLCSDSSHRPKHSFR